LVVCCGADAVGTFTGYGLWIVLEAAAEMLMVNATLSLRDMSVEQNDELTGKLIAERTLLFRNIHLVRSQ
jgi:hypothetical protein